MSTIKEALYNQCLDYVEKRMQAAQQGIDEATQAARDETKSSAGDKYETSREMMQQETNRNMAQLTEANKLKVALNALSTSLSNDLADAGSVVKTSNGNFYLSISAGSLLVDGVTYFAVSPASPIGLKLKGQKTGDEFSLNGKNYRILSIT